MHFDCIVLGLTSRSYLCYGCEEAHDFQIIGRARNDYFLKIKESIIISMLKPTLNIAKESMPLQLV